MEKLRNRPKPTVDYFGHNRKKAVMDKRAKDNLLRKRQVKTSKVSKSTALRAVLIGAVLIVSAYLAVDTWMVNRGHRTFGQTVGAADSSISSPERRP
jgi:hypothetical protein